MVTREYYRIKTSYYSTMNLKEDEEEIYEKARNDSTVSNELGIRLRTPDKVSTFNLLFTRISRSRNCGLKRWLSEPDSNDYEESVEASINQSFNLDSSPVVADISSYLKDKTKILLWDIDNCQKLLSIIDDNMYIDPYTLVIGFQGSKGRKWIKPNLDILKHAMVNRLIYFHPIAGKSKEAADMQIGYRACDIKHLTDKSVEIVVLSNDKGFEQLEKELKRDERKVQRLDLRVKEKLSPKEKLNLIKVRNLQNQMLREAGIITSDAATVPKNTEVAQASQEMRSEGSDEAKCVPSEMTISKGSAVARITQQPEETKRSKKNTLYLCSRPSSENFNNLSIENRRKVTPEDFEILSQTNEIYLDDEIDPSYDKDRPIPAATTVDDDMSQTNEEQESRTDRSGDLGLTSDDEINNGIPDLSLPFYVDVETKEVRDEPENVPPSRAEANTVVDHLPETRNIVAESNSTGSPNKQADDHSTLLNSANCDL